VCNNIGTVDRFTWFDHKPMIKRPPNDLDVIIATGAGTVPSTHKINARKKAWYIRGHETWGHKESTLIQHYKSGLINIVNSTGLQNKLKEYGVDSHIIYQGVDFDHWYDMNLRSNDKIRIGCLHSKLSSKNWNHFVQLSMLLGQEKYEYVAIGSSKPLEYFLTNTVINGDHNQLRELYSSCHIWFAPTELEGLHNVPMEAALCGCLVVCSDAPMNGMLNDYANTNTAMIYPSHDLFSAAEYIKNAQWDLIKPMQNYIKTNIRSRRDNMQALVSLLE
jgi:hypothetical protein